jgi:hypothetical protein
MPSGFSSASAIKSVQPYSQHTVVTPTHQQTAPPARLSCLLASAVPLPVANVNTTSTHKPMQRANAYTYIGTPAMLSCLQASIVPRPVARGTAAWCTVAWSACCRRASAAAAAGIRAPQVLLRAWHWLTMRTAATAVTVEDTSALLSSYAFAGTARGTGTPQLLSVCCSCSCCRCRIM